MDEKVSIAREKYTKLKEYAIAYQNIKTTKPLTTKQLRRLQYLIKQHKPKEKNKLFNIINIYKQEKDIYLLSYLVKLFKSIEDNQNLPNQDFTI